MASVRRFPERLGRYELLFPIASGGMATVYLARARGAAGFHRDVAVKLIHPHLLADTKDAAVDLIEEARLAGHIRHPNVVDVLDVADDGPGIYLVMEYIEGETLASILQNAVKRGVPLAVPLALRILSDVLEGLSAAHASCDEAGRSLHLVHRDFSPQNILVGTDGVSRLVDFGIAKAASRGGHTATGMVKGKTGYFAPEQALARPLDHRCDVFAAGVVAWETFAGKRMHAATEDPLATMFRITHERAPRLRTARPDAPPALDMALASALEIDPETRCATADELRARILSAWEAREKPADRAEVAAHVAALAAPRLLDWKERVAATLAEREARAAAPDEASAHVAVAAVQAPAPPRSRRLAVVLAVAAGLGVLAVAARAARAPAPSAPVAPIEAAAPPVAEPPPSAPAPAPGASEITVEADAPIAHVRVGDRAIAIALPARSVTIPLIATEVGRSVAIEIASVDGRRVRLDPAVVGSAAVVATFGAAAPPVRAAPAKPRAAAPPADAPRPERPDPGFATNPYK